MNRVRRFVGVVVVLATVGVLSAGRDADAKAKGGECLPELSGFTLGDEGCDGKWKVKDGVGTFTFSGDRGWGCILILGRRANEDEGPLDRSGAERLVASLKVSKGVQFVLAISEDGEDAESFKGARGADGESYSSEVFEGTGQKDGYIVRVSEMTRNLTTSANPNGNKRVDTQAVRAIVLYVVPGDGKGYITVYSLKLK